MLKRFPFLMWAGLTILLTACSESNQVILGEAFEKDWNKLLYRTYTPTTRASPNWHYIARQTETIKGFERSHFDEGGAGWKVVAGLIDVYDYSNIRWELYLREHTVYRAGLFDNYSSPTDAEFVLVLVEKTDDDELNLIFEKQYSSHEVEWTDNKDRETELVLLQASLDCREGNLQINVVGVNKAESLQVDRRCADPGLMHSDTNPVGSGDGRSVSS